MKRLIKYFNIMALVILFAITLTSCGQKDTPKFYKTSYDNGEYYNIIKESKDSDKDVYIVLVSVANDCVDDLNVNAADFTITVDNQKYTCKYFVLTYRYYSMSVNGVLTSISYIEETSSTETIEKSEDYIEKIKCAFEVNPTNSFDIYYKDTLLKPITSK